ncbi:hypothetical protein BC834DRAFT_91456 [Gloeopeniophorella convolvens]|nr:hypothetical protein BC834DRAFT_91456 [Gloeopeniophorella convolvens]
MRDYAMVCGAVEVVVERELESVTCRRANRAVRPAPDPAISAKPDLPRASIRVWQAIPATSLVLLFAASGTYTAAWRNGIASDYDLDLRAPTTMIRRNGDCKFRYDSGIHSRNQEIAGSTLRWSFHSFLPLIRSPSRQHHLSRSRKPRNPVDAAEPRVHNEGSAHTGGCKLKLVKSHHATPGPSTEVEYAVYRGSMWLNT